MTTVNKYLKNTSSDYFLNFWITIAFLTPLFACGMSYLQKGYITLDILFLCVAGLYLVLFLFFLLIKPAYKILRKTATDANMNKLALAPIGIGLLRMYWPPYQRMAEKLVSEQAIKECENALENMESLGIHILEGIEGNWNTFKEWFPRIRFGKTSEKKLQLIKSVLYEQTRQKRIELEDKLRTESESIKSTLLLKNENVAEFLKSEEVRKTTYPSCDISEESFERQFREVTSQLVELREKLNVSNSNEIFNKLFDN